MDELADIVCNEERIIKLQNLYSALLALENICIPSLLTNQMDS